MRYQKQLTKTPIYGYILYFLVIEVVSHEYGTEYNEKMVAAVDNGKSFSWCPHSHHEDTEDSKGSSLLAHSHHEGHMIEQFEEEIDIKQLKSKSSWIQQFAVLLRRMLLEMWRDTVNAQYIHSFLWPVGRLLTKGYPFRITSN